MIMMVEVHSLLFRLDNGGGELIHCPSSDQSLVIEQDSGDKKVKFKKNKYILYLA